MAKIIIVFLLALIFLLPSCEYIPADILPNIPTSTKTAPFYIPTKTRFPDTKELRVIKEWEETQSKDIRFNAPIAPWVINGGYTSTSQLGSVFELAIGKTHPYLPGVEITENTAKLSGGQVIALVQDSGAYIIHIKASGVEWWVKIGIE